MTDEKKNIQVDLWGNEVTKKYELRDNYIEPPFSVMDTKQGRWQQRRRKWKLLGIESELGRGENGYDAFKKPKAFTMPSHWQRGGTGGAT